jgi:hypothetical protein
MRPWNSNESTHDELVHAPRRLERGPDLLSVSCRYTTHRCTRWLGRRWCWVMHRGEPWKRLTTGANHEGWYCRRCGRRWTLGPR